MEKKRSIISLAKLPPEVKALMVEQYPYGISEDDVLRFPKGKNEYLYVVQVSAPDTIYLVKVDRDVNIAFGDEDYISKSAGEVEEANISEAELEEMEPEE